LKHHSDFRYSFLHLSSFDEFVNNRKKFYHTILNKSTISVFQKNQTRPSGFLANFNPARKIDVVSSEIQNKFAKKYFNEMFAELTESVPNQDYLPIILKLKDGRKFLDTLTRTEAEDIKTQFIKKSDQPVALSSKLKLALGGPFGWENMLEEGKETVLFLDSDSIYAMDDTAYSLLHSMYVVLTSQNPEDIAEHRKRLSVKLHIIFRTKANKMDTMTEFLLAFYFYEQIANPGFLKALFIFSNDSLLENYIAENMYSLATAHRHIICAKYKHANSYFKKIKKLVNKNQIMFV